MLTNTDGMKKMWMNYNLEMRFLGKTIFTIRRDGIKLHETSIIFFAHLRRI